MKLDILVPHYKESWDICHNLFDSLATQRGINFDDIHVIVANDGNEVVIPDETYNAYPFKVTTVIGEKSGVSATRNLALKTSDADYVMFADIDDMFLNNYGMHMLFSSMAEGFDMLHSSFIEEQPTDEGGWRILRHDKDITFIHGKVYRRQFLEEKEICFDESLTIHEDGYFNLIAYTESENTKYVTTPFYLWVYNYESTVRKDKKDYLFKTYSELMDVRSAMARELANRGYINESIDNVVNTVCNSYYDFCKPTATENANSVMIKNAEKSFKRFFNEFSKDFYESSANRIAEIMMVSRANAYQNGMLVEDKTMKDWLTHIKNIKA